MVGRLKIQKSKGIMKEQDVRKMVKVKVEKWVVRSRKPVNGGKEVTGWQGYGLFLGIGKGWH